MIIGKNIVRHKEIDSTSEEARRLIGGGAGEGTVVIAEAQSQGRGKPGNRWYSPAGMGAYLSVIVKPFKSPKDLSPVTLLGTRAAIETIKKVSGIDAEIKLPNDVIINGKKAGGVLVEGLSSGYLVIGIGINLNNEKGAFPEEIAGTATSLKIEAGKAFSADNFIEILIPELDKAYLEYLRKV